MFHLLLEVFWRFFHLFLWLLLMRIKTFFYQGCPNFRSPLCITIHQWPKLVLTIRHVANNWIRSFLQGCILHSCRESAHTHTCMQTRTNTHTHKHWIWGHKMFKRLNLCALPVWGSSLTNKHILPAGRCVFSFWVCACVFVWEKECVCALANWSHDGEFWCVLRGSESGARLTQQ